LAGGSHFGVGSLSYAGITQVRFEGQRRNRSLSQPGSPGTPSAIQLKPWSLYHYYVGRSSVSDAVAGPLSACWGSSPPRAARNRHAPKRSTSRTKRGMSWVPNVDLVSNF